MRQRFTKRTRLVSGLLTAAMVFTFLPFSALAAGGIHAGSTIDLSSSNFPDDAFREYLKTTVDVNGDRRLIPAERNAVTEINVSGKNISNLYGIQFFPNLKKLNCYNNQLTSLDVHENTALEYLDCDENRLTSLDVSQNAALQSLSCHDNQLTILNVRQNTALEYLSCSKNRLTELDVSQNTKLEQLFCYENNLTSLDVSQNAALKRLDCEKSQLTSLDVSQNPALQILYCDSNRLTSLDVSQNTALGILSCTKNQLTELDVSKNTALLKLYYDYNQLTSLQADNCTNLSAIGYDNNEYSVQVYESTRILDPGILPGNFDINRTRNWSGATTNADGTLTVNPGVGKVNYEYRFFENYYAPFTLNVEVIPEGSIAIDASNFPDPNFRAYVKAKFDKNNDNFLSESERNAVTSIDLHNGYNGQKLVSLDGIEHFPNLTTLICYNNQLTSLDVSKNTGLLTLSCYENNLTSLDVSQNTKLEELLCGKNQLTELDVRNNTALWCLSCPENKLTSLDVSQHTQLEQLDCGRNQLTELDVRNKTRLWYLACSENNLTSLDVSQNPALQELYCGKNRLASLDVSQNTNLAFLSCDNNKIDINIEETSRTFDLSTLPGFDVSKATNWKGGTVNGSTLKVDAGATQVTYTYDCGNDRNVTFTLNVNVVPDSTVTPPSGGGTGTTTPPSGGGTGTTTPPSGGGTGTTTPPSGGGTGTTTPPSGGGTGTTTPPSGGSTGGGGGGAAILLVGGAAVAGLVGYGVYSYVSEQQLKALLPEGVAVPENRAQTALLLWNTAGRPEPAAQPAFSDVADPDTAKAAQWCMEQNLLQTRRDGAFAPDSTLPAYKTLKVYRQLTGK